MSEHELSWPLIFYYLRADEILPYAFCRKLLMNGIRDFPPCPESFTALIQEKLPEYSNLKEELSAVLNVRWQGLAERAERLGDYCRQHNIELLSPGSPDYPLRLAATSAAPLVLFAEGQIKKLREPAAFLACVGSRKMTPYAERFLTQELAKIMPYQVSIVSGLARGCDTRAHVTALKEGGFTVACLANGTDVYYPPEHKKIQEEIKEKGVLLSEYAPGTKPRPYRFPARNRIIAGLSDACFIAEAAASSGSLITADLAADEGREVGVLCASVFALSSAGSNALLREGAMPVLNYQDLLDLLGINEEKRAYQGAYAEDLPPLLQAVSETPLSEMELSLKLGMPLKEVRMKILEYEAKGSVRRFRGRIFLTKT